MTEPRSRRTAYAGKLFDVVVEDWRWRELGGFWTSPGFLREYMHVFVAGDLEAGESDPDEDEEIVRWPLAEIAGRIGELEDAKTIAGLLLYLRTCWP